MPGPIGDSRFDPLDASTLAETLRAIAHPTRLCILNHLVRVDSATTPDLHQQVAGGSIQGVHAHMQALMVAGVVHREPHGPNNATTWRLNRQALTNLGFLLGAGAS